MIASLLSLRELGNVVIVTNSMFILPRVHDKFTDMSNAVKSAQLSLN